MAKLNRLIKFQLTDRNMYEIQSSNIVYDIVFGEESEEYIIKSIQNPIIRVDITGNIAKFYVDSDLIITLSYYKGVIIRKNGDRSKNIRIVPGFLDVAIKKELYDLSQEYNIKDWQQIGLTVNGQIIRKIGDYTHWPVELDSTIFDKYKIDITENGQDIIHHIRLATKSYDEYISNNKKLSKEVSEELNDSGLLETFQDFLKQYL